MRTKVIERRPRVGGAIRVVRVISCTETSFGEWINLERHWRVRWIPTDRRCCIYSGNDSRRSYKSATASGPDFRPIGARSLREKFGARCSDVLIKRTTSNDNEMRITRQDGDGSLRTFEGTGASARTILYRTIVAPRRRQIIS